MIDLMLKMVTCISYNKRWYKNLSFTQQSLVKLGYLFSH